MPNTPYTSGPIDTSLGTSTPPDLAADANALMDEAKAAAGKIADEAGEQIASLTDRAKQEVGDATEKVKSLAGDQKDQLADQMGGVAEAMERAADELDASNGDTARYARMIADNAEKLSSTIRDNSVDDLLGMAQDFGRRQPAMFIGAAALLGFAASRFVMASAKRRDAAIEPAPAYQPNSTSPQQGPADSQSLGEM
ncbi:MAG: hypothetical protein EOP22_12175 [Hyphomicrobiales bacterium]|nr:MAG: hypothetical protein EOP22_12175 [Hyphomicrobiales bacterium]